MQDYTPPLDAAVVTTTDDLAAMHENRTDWDVALAETLPGFLDGCFENRANYSIHALASTEQVAVWFGFIRSVQASHKSSAGCHFTKLR